MDASTFFSGYFVGLVIGTGATLWWTARYGSISLKAMGRCWRDLAGLTDRRKPPAPFSTSRNDDAPAD